jgi:very-short-patch-repair endonuclease
MGRLKSGTSMPKDAQVAWRAARQHGVISHAQLVGAGLSQTEIDRRVAAGWLHRLHRGVFAVGHRGLTERGRWAAAAFAGGDGAVLSHRSAAALWGLCRDGDRPAITVPGRDRRGPARVEVHAGRLRPDETVIFDGIRVTSVGRTLLDIAEQMTQNELVRAIDTATNTRRIGPTTMPSVINAATGRRGARTLKQALLITRPQDVLTRSELERRALRLIRRAGIEPPHVNARLHGLEVDLLWRPSRLVVELDGREHHDTDTAFDRDTRRSGDLMAHGWWVGRLTWRQVVNDPGWVTSRLSSWLHRGGEPLTAH